MYTYICMFMYIYIYTCMIYNQLYPTRSLSAAAPCPPLPECFAPPPGRSISQCVSGAKHHRSYNWRLPEHSTVLNSSPGSATLGTCAIKGRWQHNHWHTWKKKSVQLFFSFLLLFKYSIAQCGSIIITTYFFALYSVLGISSQCKYV